MCFAKKKKFLPNYQIFLCASRLVIRRSRRVFPLTMPFVPEELLTDGPPAAAPAAVPRPRRGQGGEPAVLRAPPVPPGASAGTAHLEPPAPTSWPAGRLTFHPLCIHHGARDETSTGSLLCSCVSHDATLLAQADLAAPVLGILMSEGQNSVLKKKKFFFFFLLYTFFFLVVLFSPPCVFSSVFFFGFCFVFKAKRFCDEQLSCFVLNLF